MKKISFACLMLLVLSMFVKAQSISKIDSLIITGKQQLHDAVNIWQEQNLINARAVFERLLSDNTYPYLIHYYIALADYRLVSFYFSKEDKESARKYIDDGIEHLKQSITLNDKFAEAFSLLSSLYGNKIGTNPLLGMTLGPQSGKSMNEAIRLESTNPRTYLIAGWSAYFTPKMFGGGKDKATENFEHAISFFDSAKVQNPILPDWGEAEAHAWLGSVYLDQVKFEAARKEFERALVIDPNYGWVKYVLMPKLNQETEQSQK